MMADPSETALAVIKGGAQRWNEVRYPTMVTFICTNLYHFMPETFGALIRSVEEPSIDERCALLDQVVG